MPKNRPATSGYARLAQEEEDRANDPYEFSDDDDLYHTSSTANPYGTQYEPIATRSSMPSATLATPPEHRRRSSAHSRRARRNSAVDIKAINARLERWAEEFASKFKIHRVKGKTLEEEKLEIYHSVFQAPNGVQPITAEELDSEEVESANREAREGFEDVVESVRLAIELGVHPRMISQGSSGSYFARNSEGKVVGVFKPKDEEPYASRNPKWTKWIHRNLFPCFFGRACLIPNLSYVSEAAAYVLDSRLRTNLVPYTGIVWLSSKSFYYDFWDRRKAWMGKKSLPPKAGSFQVFLRGFRDANLFLREHPWPDQTNTGFRGQDAPKRKKRPWNESCRPSGLQSDDEDEDEYVNGQARMPSPQEESRERRFHWTEGLKQSFREELEKLVILDYIMRNTDRGLDNWMIKIDWKTEEVSIVAEPPKQNEPQQDDDDHLVPPRPVSVNSDKPATPSYPYRRHEAMVAVSRTGTPLNAQEPQATVQIGAIDNSLSWPWKHPDAWRSFPFGWLFLPVSLIGQPFSQRTRDHFLPLLTSTAWWSGTQIALRRVFSQDDDFKESMFARQIAVMKGQAWNVVETLKQPDHGPLELTRRTRVCVWDDLVDVPVAIPLRGPSTEAQRRKVRTYDDRYDPDNEEMDIGASMNLADQDLMGFTSPPSDLPNPNRFELSHGRNSRDSGRPQTASTTDYGYSRDSTDVLGSGDRNWPSLPTRPGNKHQKHGSVSSARGQAHLIWSSDDLEGDLGYAAAEGMEGNQRKVIVERIEAVKSKNPKNGNHPSTFPSWPDPPYDPCTGSSFQDEPYTSLYLSSRRSPTPPDDPLGSDSESSLDQGTGQQGINSQPRGVAPSFAPPGTTSSVAHRLLSPQRPPSAHRASPITRSPNPSLAEPTSASSSPRIATHATPDIDVQFTNTSGLDVSDGKRSVDMVELDDDVDARHGNLIENMFGVERRAGTPYKKVKIDNERIEKMNRGSFGGNSGLGEYMKEDDGDQSSSTAITPDVVDLTTDVSGSNDDDDLQVTGSNNLSIQRVCYGKLDNAQIQASLIPMPAPQTIIGDSAHWPSIKLQVHRQVGQGNNRIEVSDPNQKIFGVIDAKTAAVIVPLLDTPAMKVDITARLDVRKKLPHEVPWSPCSTMYRASINLYGLRQDAERVGNRLAQHNVWLATPFSVEQGVPVFNPHAEKRRLQPNWAPTGTPMGTQRNRVVANYEVRTAEEVTDAVMKMFDQLQSADNIPEMEPPSFVTTPLLHHQKQALWFMMEKETPRKFGPEEEDNNSLWRMEYHRNGSKKFREIISGTVLDEEPPQSLGGLLADMMGLGKTLSILSLAVSSLTQARAWATMPPSPELVRSQPGIRNTKTTLLVVPLSTVNNWVSQIKEHLQDDALSSYVFHGSSRTTSVDELSKYDLVITTYSIVLSEISGRGSRRAGMSPLIKMNMFRIVLDEAHTIREQSAAQTQAIFKLHSDRRWSVTGTPIQNRLEDLLSVTKFLGLYPYDDRSRFGMHILSRFKTGDATVLASLRVLVDSFTLRRVKDKIDIPTRHDKILMLEFTETERQLHEFFRKESNVMMRVIAGDDKKQMKGRMYHHILKAMMILRQISAHGKELLDNDERMRIKGLSVNDAIDLEEGSSDNATDKKAYEMFTLMQESSADMCAVCGKRLEEPSIDGAATPSKPAPLAIVLPCFDVLCPDCFSGSKQVFDGQPGGFGSYDVKCSVCDGWIPAAYSTITADGLEKYIWEQAQAKQTRKHAKTMGEYEGPHTKTRALLSHLLSTAEESTKLPEGEPPMKSVVFSAWTSHLDLIEIALRDNGLTGYTRLDGAMTLTARNKALDTFRDDSNITVLLATIGAGGVGLNLTAASNVYIMEPQYNPAAVAQAIDRVHRLGQKREVTTVQFLMKDSIEEKIFELAKKKQQLADMSLNRGKLDKSEVQESRMREYRGLFK
ncbi:SNF2 family N-terminal domain-containing protein [Aspergillus cavernicola]|uniref:1-phosphatidylinositol 4-kinase n=1 Tax=Aspergillus cavernicola TaxID=176166 RepID=A0ABR4IBR8_9EURO